VSEIPSPEPRVVASRHSYGGAASGRQAGRPGRLPTRRWGARCAGHLRRAHATRRAPPAQVAAGGVEPRRGVARGRSRRARAQRPAHGRRRERRRISGLGACDVATARERLAHRDQGRPTPLPARGHQRLGIDQRRGLDGRRAGVARGHRCVRPGDLAQRREAAHRRRACCALAQRRWDRAPVDGPWHSHLRRRRRGRSRRDRPAPGGGSQLGQEGAPVPVRQGGRDAAHVPARERCRVPGIRSARRSTRSANPPIPRRSSSGSGRSSSSWSRGSASPRWPSGPGRRSPRYGRESRRVYRKLQVRTRKDAIARAEQAGLFAAERR
jgi:hypothetical protein